MTDLVPLLALALVAQAKPPIADAEAEIVVVGRRLASVAAIVSRDPRGKLACSLSESSGDRGVDSALCKAAAKCVGKGAVDKAAVTACIEKRKPAILKEFAARVRAKKG